MGIESSPRFGLVLPHFGAGLQVSQMLEVAQLAERSGFESLWVRDRLVAGSPHGLLLEAGGTSFLEPLLSLAAVAAVTDRIMLGTAVLLPNRHPLRLVQEVGTLWRIADGRLAMGLGLGVGSKNFELLGLDYRHRVRLFEETAKALRGEISGLGVEDIDPAPGKGLKLYYGGVSRAAVRRAFEHTDGWIAGRLPRDTFRDRMELVGRYRAETGRILDVASMPITVVDSGDGRHFDIVEEAVGTLARSAEGAGGWIKPPSGRFETVDDLAGLLITGPAEQCAEQASSMLQSGVSHLIFDLRLVFGDCSDQITMLAEEILPLVRRHHGINPDLTPDSRGSQD